MNELIRSTEPPVQGIVERTNLLEGIILPTGDPEIVQEQVHAFEALAERLQFTRLHWPWKHEGAQGFTLAEAMIMLQSLDPNQTEPALALDTLRDRAREQLLTFDERR